MLFLFYLFQENRTAFVRPCQKKSIFPDTRWQTDWWPVSGRTQLALFHSYTVQGTSCAWLNDFIMKLRKSHLVTAEWIRAMMVKLGGGLGQRLEGLWQCKHWTCRLWCAWRAGTKTEFVQSRAGSARPKALCILVQQKVMRNKLRREGECTCIMEKKYVKYLRMCKLTEVKVKYYFMLCWTFASFITS